MDTSGSHDPLHDDGASRDDDAEGHFKKQLFGPLHPSKLSLRRVNTLKGLGHREQALCVNYNVFIFSKPSLTVE